MRVLHIITGLGAGGAEQQLRLLLRRLPVAADVVCLTNPGSVARGLRSDGVRVVDLGMRSNRDLSALPRLTRLIRDGRYDVVHTHLYRACVHGRIAARLAGVPTVVATEHSLGDHRIEGRPLTRATRALYLATERLGSATVAVSATVAERLRAWGVPADRVHTVPNGIEAARFRFDPAARAATRARLGLPPDAFVVGGVGRLVPGKRFDEAVRAVAALPDTRLLLVGDGPERAALRRLAGALGAGDRVHLVGECEALADPGGVPGKCEALADPGGVPGERAALAGPGSAAATTAAAPDVPSLLSAMDLFVSPSADEAFGLAVVEALAAGLPVLHAACPAVDERPAEDAPGAHRIPPAVRAYDIAHCAERVAHLYEHLAGHPHGRRATGRAPDPYPGAGRPRRPTPSDPQRGALS
ncbi:glycosyltransferase [Streptomyces sp. URMC 123]|uniref:glycosyltransferase n=1 Tax=Streptomyces sp. URMC 123 TaxID=3423403 RepID=UPI003F1BFA1C